MAILNVFAGNILILDSEASSNFKFVSVSSSLLLVDSNLQKPYNRSLSSLVPFHQTASLTYGSRTVSLVSSLNLSHSTQPRATFVSAENILLLTQDARRTHYEQLTSELDLSQALDELSTPNLPSNLNLTQSVTLSHHTSHPLESTLNLESVVAYYLNDRTFYSTDTPIPTLPTPVTTSVCGDGGTAVYPRNIVLLSQGSISIELPRPEIGNADHFNFTRINRRSRGGDLIVYRDEQWPKTRTLTLNFNWLTENQKQSILTFMQNTIGQQVTFQDHYGNTWLGFIMTPQNKVVQESLNNKSLSLEFQGTKQ